MNEPDAIDLALDSLIANRCRVIEYEVVHATNRRGESLVRGVVVRPTAEEFGRKALVLWGMMQLSTRPAACEGRQ